MSNKQQEDPDSKNLWDRIQIAATIITPFILGIGGVYINFSQKEISKGISRLENTIGQVQVMQPYIESILDRESKGKAATAAHALYMLKKEDPETIIRLLLSAGNPNIDNVLLDLCRSDSTVVEIVLKSIHSKEGLAPFNELLERESVPARILADTSISSKGWCYLARFSRKGIHFISYDFFKFLEDRIAIYGGDTDKKDLLRYFEQVHEELHTKLPVESDRRANLYTVPIINELRNLLLYCDQSFMRRAKDRDRFDFTVKPFEFFDPKFQGRLQGNRPVGYVRNEAPSLPEYRLGEIIGCVSIGEQFHISDLEVVELGVHENKSFIIWGNIEKTGLPVSASD